LVISYGGRKLVIRQVEERKCIGYYSIGINILLVEIKYSLAFFSGSIALVADAIHSLSDLVSSATVLAGIKISKGKSKIFPCGQLSLFRRGGRCPSH